MGGGEAKPHTFPSLKLDVKAAISKLESHDPITRQVEAEPNYLELLRSRSLTRLCVTFPLSTCYPVEAHGRRTGDKTSLDACAASRVHRCRLGASSRPGACARWREAPGWSLFRRLQALGVRGDPAEEPISVARSQTSANSMTSGQPIGRVRSVRSLDNLGHCPLATLPDRLAHRQGFEANDGLPAQTSTV